MNYKETDSGQQSLIDRDLQEIKITLREFSKNVVDQLRLFGETMSQTVAQSSTISKDVNDIEVLLKGFEKTVSYYEDKLENIINRIKSLENKTVDKNNQEALTVSIDKLKESLKEISLIISKYNATHVYTKEERLALDNQLKNIETSLKNLTKEIEKMRDVKKNLSWWIDWIYKVLLTFGLIYGFFIK